MLRVQLLFAVVLGLLGAGSFLLNETDDRAQQRPDALDRRIRQRAAFVQHLDGWFDDLRHNRRSLRAVVDEVRACAEASYPHYLVYLAIAHGELSEEKRIASNLLLGFCCQDVSCRTPIPGMEETFTRLRAELDRWRTPS